ncbi:hypothetical protein [Butyricimonas synergistica]|uniref:golvesin C-terminal-like domain-containing protein n=1 Tax=Butyricimonas synergistica TaxID=544644 RepID=UPI00036F1F0A|nr:hypothetical protein [Butyricimonas synergistica]
MDIKNSWHSVWLVARYESKIIRRDFLFWVLIFLVVGVITYYQAVKQGNFGGASPWCLVSMPSSIPLMNAYLFNIFQSFILIFVCSGWYRREIRTDSLQVIYVRPQGNIEYTIGKALGVFRVFLGVNMVSLGVAFLINLFASQAPLRFSLYLYYFFSLNLPSLCFVLGFSFLIVRFVRNAALSLFILLCWIASVILVLPSLFYGTFDVLGVLLPNFFSMVIGHPFVGNFFSQRIAIFLLGIGCLFLSIMLSWRLCYGKKEKIGLLFFSIFLLFAGEIFSWNYHRFYSDTEVARAVYRDTFLKYGLVENIHVEYHEIIYRQQGAELNLSSKLTLINTLDREVDSVILYLNPGLKVHTLVSAGQPLGYTREHQAIVISRKMLPSDTLRLFMEYSGCIDENVCYLDKPLRMSNSYGDTPFRFGQRYCYVGEDYTLLLPEVLWYPLTYPPTNLHHPDLVQLDFTSFVLDLPGKSRKTVITQGMIRRDKEQVVGTDPKCPGLTLCIGDYEKKIMWMGKYSLELYYFRGHKFFESFPLLDKKEIKKIVADVMDANSLLTYPYKRLCLVESPISFFVPIREWKGTSDFIQPGMIFLPEQGTTLERGAVLKNFARSSLQEERQPQEIQRYRLTSLIQGTLFNPICRFYKGSTPIERLFSFLDNTSEKSGVSSRYVEPLFLDYSSYLFSRDMAVVDYVLRRMKIEWDKYYGWGMINPMQNDLPFLSYFSKHSLEDALRDSSLSLAFRKRLLTLKTLSINAYLCSQIPNYEIYNFLADFQNRNRYKWPTLQQFNREIEDKYGVNIYPFLEMWYRDTALPCFDVRDVSFFRVSMEPGLERKEYKIHFKVRNTGKAGGTLSVLITPNGFRVPFDTHYFWISPGECKEVKLYFDTYPNLLTLSMGVAANLPNFFEYRCESAPWTSDKQIGIFDCTPGVFETKSDEIIVDNDDPNFRLIDKDERETLALLRGKKEKYKEFWKASSRWQYTLNSYCYGNTIKSACVKLVGDGSAKAEWMTEIPRDGIYEIFARYIQFGPQYPTLPSFAELHYTVISGEEVSEVVIDTGDRSGMKGSEYWISLGEFALKAGQAKVILDDRGKQMEDAKRLVFADAIKFVRKMHTRLVSD